MFKFIGVIAGFLLFGFFGSILGYIVGAIIDRARALGAGGMNPLTNALRQGVFLETVFLLMGKLAKADGQISQIEIDHVEQFIQKLGMTTDHRTQAIRWFNKGADPAFEIEPTCKRFMSICGQTRDLKQVLLVYLIVIALADGHFHPVEEALLTEVARYLGYDQAAFKQLMDMVLNQSRFGSQQTNPAEALDDAYKALGVTKENTDQEIKRAYRKLMSQYHPDKLMGQGMPEDMIAVATEQAKEIQLAYDLIKKNRNI
ncbi:heat shock protein DnaJ domain protein [Sulfuricella denitrificans skB26]|uniref:Heat shock protein DnaJ domain protein n=1 Tax=Sulfuricella denitrificans (strain DSM 22764 / NBRC 105220 / skB26) TaxID=1163617 RepID=S6ACE0_SULDS|nr:co-chaperone DjlA [Sulfuricella denitrificans]BAN35503.1 heat shock protein DnaJ domain protein [Sulfuricella denitrificans skB26]